MNEIQILIKWLQSPLGQMLTNAGKDVVTNHIIPYVRNNAMQTKPMTDEEQKKRANEEFADVSDEFTIDGGTNANSPPDPQ